MQRLALVLVAFILLSGGFVSATGPKLVPGYVYIDGAFVPDEPYREGQPRATGLQHPFPPMPSLETNPIKPEKVELGRLLFFDPILSGDNTMSCATCHHPDFGFSDGRRTSMGVGGRGVGPERSGGERLFRSAPTLWNAAYNHLQFWDGRAKDLEEQARMPITSKVEMNQDPDELVGELRAIPEYVRLFEDAFAERGAAAITFDNVVNAIASFERTILSFNSRFDRYTQGDGNALSDQEKRGLALFRSLKTRCFECHRFPTFADHAFRVIGVPGSGGDPGRAGVPGQGPDGAFKVPTLRNIELTAPYMHNGAFATLEEVIQFYADGAGHSLPRTPDGMDDKIGKFPITDEEKADLVAFLKSLTDTSLQPDAPRRVPSGLPVVEVNTKAAPAPLPVAFAARENRPAVPSREFFDRIAQSSETQTPSKTAGATFSVRKGGSIQEAVDRAQPGDRIEVYPAEYNQSVVVDKSGITIVGVKEDGRRPVLDGEYALDDAFQVSGDDFRLEGFIIQNYMGNGVVVSKAKNVVLRDLNIHAAGLYGVYPVECEGVLVEGCVVSKSSDAGIYVGQSRDIAVRNNEVYLNVAGIEIENSVNALVENNSAHHNTAGILVFCLPNNPSKEASHAKVVNNRIWANNLKNFGAPGSTVSTIPPGLGVVVMAADRTRIEANVFEENGTYAIAVLGIASSKLSGDMRHELDIEPNPDDTYIHENVYINNGNSPSEQFKRDYPEIPSGDLFWDGAGERNQWDEPMGLITHPKDLLKTHGGLHTDVIDFI